MKQAFSLFLSFFLLYGVFTSSVFSQETLFLAKGGKTGFTIVLADDPKTIERTAAKELKEHLDEITGFAWNIASEKNVPENSPQILVGFSARAKKLFPEIDEKKIPYDGIEIHTKGNKLLLAGHEQRGTLYAVNTFLEDSLGVRWWTSTEKDVPKNGTIKFEPLRVSYAPKLIYRESFYKDAFESIFASRMKCNGAHERISPEYGGHHRFVYFVHSFYPLIPPEKYFQDHPEWFSEIDGKRTHDRAQLCLTNDEMRKELTKNALEMLRKNSDARFISISQNDWYGYCTCEKCKQLAEKEGSQAGPMVHFVNQVAKEIEKEFPDVWVETLAYQYTRRPPKLVKPRDNVVIRLCTIECSFVRPLNHEQNHDFYEDLTGWSKIAKHLFIWDYVTNFSSSILPHPNLRVLEPNIRIFVDNGTLGLFEQGDAYCTVGDFVRMRNWVISHMMWNPEKYADPKVEKKLFDEFLVGYYGPEAAKTLAEYFDLLIDRAEASGKHIGCFRESTADWLNFDTLYQATALFDKAISQAENKHGKDSSFAQRLRREKLPLMHVWLKKFYLYKRTAEAQKKPFPFSNDPIKLCDEFFALCDKYKVTAYREFNTPEQFAEFKKNIYQRFGPEASAPAPEEFKNRDPQSWMDIQEYEFRIANVPHWGKIVDDPNASNGRAARMPGDHHEWAVSARLEDILDPTWLNQTGDDQKTKAEYKIYAWIRCEATGKEGTALTCGVYDEKEKKGVAGKTLSIPEINGSKYHKIELGPLRFGSQMYLWFAPPQRKDDVQAVYIDRIVIERL